MAIMLQLMLKLLIMLKNLLRVKLKVNLQIPELIIQLWREFQSYRVNMTGAAFSEAESRDYASVNPTLNKSLNLNLSVIEGALNQLENRVTSTINTRIPNDKKLYNIISGQEKETIEPAVAKVGTVLEMGGKLYKKIGEDQYEEL